MGGNKLVYHMDNTRTLHWNTNISKVGHDVYVKKYVIVPPFAPKGVCKALFFVSIVYFFKMKVNNPSSTSNILEETCMVNFNEHEGLHFDHV